MASLKFLSQERADFQVERQTSETGAI